MWLFILAYGYSCSYASSRGLTSSTTPWDIPVCQAFTLVNGIIMPEVLYFGSCYTDNSRVNKFIFDYCECRIPEEGESYTYKQDTWDRAIFCYNYTNNPTKTPQATKIIQPVLKQPECSHYKKPKTALAVFYQLIFIA